MTPRKSQLFAFRFGLALAALVFATTASACPWANAVYEFESASNHGEFRVDAKCTKLEWQWRGEQAVNYELTSNNGNLIVKDNIFTLTLRQNGRNVTLRSASGDTLLFKGKRVK